MTTDRIQAAHDTLRANDRGGYTVPNPRIYPFQWNWDSAFVAIGYASDVIGWTAQRYEPNESPANNSREAMTVLPAGARLRRIGFSK